MFGMGKLAKFSLRAVGPLFFSIASPTDVLCLSKTGRAVTRAFPLTLGNGAQGGLLGPSFRNTERDEIQISTELQNPKNSRPNYPVSGAGAQGLPQATSSSSPHCGLLRSRQAITGIAQNIAPPAFQQEIDELLRCIRMFRGGDDSKRLVNRIVQFLIHLYYLARLFEHE
jgi:hypothetical protein